MIDLVDHEKVKDLLHESIEEKNKKFLAQAVRKCAEALHVLLSEYRKDISKDWDSKIFDFGNERTVEDAVLRNDDKRNKVRDFSSAYGRMSDAVTIIGFGIDYRKYAKFMMIAPSVSFTGDGSVHYGGNKNLSNITVEEFQFCHDFVIDTAVRLQEFEIDPDALTTTRTQKKITEWREEARRVMAEQKKATE
jgi:hypothetical protein